MSRRVAAKGRAVKNRTFIVKALWDQDAGVFVSESDIVVFILRPRPSKSSSKSCLTCVELNRGNHRKPQELVKNKISDLIPTIFWERPAQGICSGVSLVDGFQKAVVKELKRLGYYRKGGSKHPKWRHDGGRPTVMVPHKILSKRTANGILQDAGSDLRL